MPAKCLIKVLNEFLVQEKGCYCHLSMRRGQHGIMQCMKTEGRGRDGWWWWWAAYFCECLLSVCLSLTRSKLKKSIHTFILLLRNDQIWWVSRENIKEKGRRGERGNKEWIFFRHKSLVKETTEPKRQMQKQSIDQWTQKVKNIFFFFSLE